MKFLFWEFKRRHDEPPPDPHAPHVHAVGEEAPASPPGPSVRTRKRRIGRMRGISVEMAIDMGPLKKRLGEFYVAARWVPKSTINESFHRRDGKLPWRLLSFRRRLTWPDYDTVVKNNAAVVVSESGITAFGRPVLIAVGVLVAFIWSLMVHWTNTTAFGIWILILVAWLFPVTPVWLYLRYLRWWSGIFVVREAELIWYQGWLRPTSGDWSAEALAEVRVRFRGTVRRNEISGKGKNTRWLFSNLFSLYWRMLLIGDVLLVDAAGTVYGEIANIQNPKNLADNLIHAMATKLERESTVMAANSTATRLAAELTLQHVADQAYYARQALRAQLVKDGVSAADIDAILEGHPSAAAATTEEPAETD